MAAEFASLDGMGGSIPNASPNMDRLGLTVPGDVITGTTAGMQALGAQNIKTDASRQRIVVNDSNTNRVSFGRIGTGVNDWGLKVSKTGINVDTATNDQLVFNSSQDVFKIVTSGIVNLPVTPNGSVNSAGVTHNLGFIPSVLAYTFYNSLYYVPLPYFTFGVSTTVFNINICIYVDSITSTNISFTAACGGGGALNVSVPVKYYLLQETAS